MPGITDPAEEYFKDGQWAWDPAGAEWLKMILDPLTNRLVVDHPGDIEVVQPVPNDLRVGNYGWDGSAWRKLPLIWGYSDVYHETIADDNASVTFDALATSVVPNGEVWVITYMIAFDIDNAITKLTLLVHDGTTGYTLREKVTIAAGVEIIFTGYAVLKKDWYTEAHFWGCTAGDNIRLHVHGYKMKVAE